MGKTSCARIFAKTINCTSRTADGEACDACDSPPAVQRGAVDGHRRADAASHNGTDDIRQLIEQVMTPSRLGGYRVFIIEELHMLTAQALTPSPQNPEEPAAMWCSSWPRPKKHKIIPTILSRCRIYDFNRNIGAWDMVARCTTWRRTRASKPETEALNVIARQGRRRHARRPRFRPSGGVRGGG